MDNRDWLPRREQDLVDLLFKWKQDLADTAKQTAFGWDTAICAALTADIEQYTTRRDIYIEDRSPENRIARDNAKAIVEDGVREFATQSVRNNNKMQAQDKFYLGVHLPNNTHTPSPLPTTYPFSRYDLNTPGRIGITSEDNESGHKSMPAGVRWIEHTWFVVKPLEKVPDPLPNIDAFDQFKTWTKPSEHCVLPFTEDQRRGVIVHTSRWVNTRSEPGPWAPIEIVTIP